MKKIFSKLLLPIMALGMFAACDDVPAPYYVLSPEDAETTIEGEGTAEVPYTVNDALAIINAGTYTSSPVFVEGIITQIDNIDPSYGNATYYIADESAINEDGSVSQQLEVYRGYYLNSEKFTSEDQLKVGDHVIVYGQLTLYGSTPEVTQGSMVYEHNGKYSDNPESDVDPAGSGTYADPYNVAAAKNLISTGQYTSDKVYVKGIVSKIDNIDTSYGNATYYFSDDGSTTGQLEVYRGYSLGGEKFKSQDELAVGDTIIVYGVLTLYGSTQEITQGSSIVYLNGQSTQPEEPGEPGEASGSGTVDDPYNTVAANNLANSLADNAQSDVVYIKGKVVSITQQYGTQFGNATFYISPDGTTTDQFYVYRALYLNNQKYTSGDQLQVGDDVVICGKVTNYKGNTPETVQNEAYLYSLNGKTSGGDEPGPSGEAKGDGTLNNPYNSVAANQICTALAADAKTDNVYIKGKIVAIRENYGTQFGNATFYISDDGTTTDQFCVWRTLYFNNEKYTSGDLLQVGDEVIIYGKMTNYKGNTPETVQNESYLYSLNGKTASGDDPSPTPSEGEGDGSYANPYNMTAAQSIYNADNSAKTSAYVKGYVVGYVNGNAMNANTTTFGIPEKQETEILIAASADEDDYTKCIPIQLPTGDIRNGLDIYTNPSILGQTVILYGSIERYFGTCGMRSTSYGEWSGGTVGTKTAKKRR